MVFGKEFTPPSLLTPVIVLEIFKNHPLGEKKKEEVG
jgi:hypothetical protein